MFRNLYTCIAVAAIGCGLIAEAQPKTKSTAAFSAGCSNPSFPTPPPKTLAPIDTQCPLTGQPGEAAPETAQNKQKNNFCATAPTKSAIAVADMVTLQKQVEMNPAINFGPHGPTTDRTPLKVLGEGQMRVLEGFVFIARQEGKEAVNCGSTFASKSETVDHDIHISIVGDSSLLHGNECESVVAEMSPHHRPDSWIPANVMQVANKHLRVRVSGQLFFDSSHTPCVDGKAQSGDPARSSLWELHPIYKFEVCPAGDCATGTGWQALDVWITKNAPSNGKNK